MIPDPAQDPETTCSQQEWKQMLSYAMHGLPHKTRRAIELRELDERSTEETARIMGISVAAVKARIFHGRKRLRKRLEQFVESAWTFKRETSRAFGKSRCIFQNRVAPHVYCLCLYH